MTYSMLKDSIFSYLKNVDTHLEPRIIYNDIRKENYIMQVVSNNIILYVQIVKK